jgi:hypothetical protein
MLLAWTTRWHALLALLLASALASAQIHVDPRLGNDQSGDGSQGSPYRSVTRALQGAGSGATIRAAAGFYSSATGEVLPIRLAPGIRIVGQGSQESFLTGPGSGAGILADVPLDSTTVFEGFAVRGFSVGIDVRSPAVFARFVGVRVAGGSLGARVLGLAPGLTAPRFESCAFDSCGNQGVLVTAQAAADLRPVLVNCIVASCQGGGIGSAPQAAGSIVAPRIAFCTVARNGGRGIYADPGAGQSAVEVYNSIVVGHASDLVNVQAALTGTNLLGGGPLVGLRGNFSGSAVFLAETGGDFHLLGGSSAIDRADGSLPEQPVVDRDGQTRPGGGQNDVGADERELQTLYLAEAEGPRIGRPLVLRHIASAGDFMVLFLSLGERSPGFIFPGLSGKLTLDVGILLEPLVGTQIPGVAYADVPIPIPDDGGIVGAQIFFQAVAFRIVGGNLAGGFSGVVDPVLLPR